MIQTLDWIFSGNALRGSIDHVNRFSALDGGKLTRRCSWHIIRKRQLYSCIICSKEIEKEGWKEGWKNGSGGRKKKGRKERR